jgi:competence protein ComEC
MQFYRQLRLQPFTRLLIPLVTGIITGFYYHPDHCLTGSVLSGLTVLAFFIHEFNRSYRLRWLFGIAISLILFFTGLLIMNIQEAKIEKAKILAGSTVDYIAMVSDEMTETEKLFRTRLLIKTIHEDTVNHVNIRVMAYLSKDRFSEELQPGDMVMAHSVLKEFSEPENPFEFNYRRWMEYQGIVLQTYLKSTAWHKIGNKKGLKSWISEIRHQVVYIYEKSGISNDELAVLSALTLGIREDLPSDIKESFAISGAMHVLAVSGLHVGIIFLVLNVLLSFTRKFRYGRQVRTIMIIIFLWIFALLTGLRPSVVRAVFMFSIIQTGQGLKRPPDMYNTISLSAFCLLLINPFLLVDVGFQLSYLAITGIVFFQPRIYRLAQIKNSFIDRVWQLFTVSAAAQLVTAPLTIFYFHYFPVYFWLTNLFVIVLTGLILYMAVFQIIIFSLHLPYFLSGEILNFFLWLLNRMTSKVQCLPYSLIENINISLFETLLCYVIIISMTIYLLKLTHKALIWSCLVVLVMTVYETFVAISNAKQNSLIVFNVRDHSVVGIVNGGDIVFLSDIPNAHDICETFPVQNYLIKRGINRVLKVEDVVEIPDNGPGPEISIVNAGANIFFETGHFRGLLLKSYSNFPPEPVQKLKLDCIILSQNVNVSSDQLMDLFLFRYIILDSSNKNSYRITWLDMDQSDDFIVHSVADSKAIEIKKGKIRNNH